MTYLLRLVACLFLCISLNSFGALLGFDDVDAPSTGASFFSASGPFIFEDNSIYNQPSRGGIRIANGSNSPTSYYNYMMSSPDNFAFVSSSSIISMTLASGGRFNFTSAKFGRSHIPSLNNFLGFRDGEIVFQVNFMSNWVSENIALHYQEFNWNNVDRIDFWSEHYVNGSSVIDDITYTVNPVPIPAGITLFLSGLVGLGLMRGRDA